MQQHVTRKIVALIALAALAAPLVSACSSRVAEKPVPQEPRGGEQPAQTSPPAAVETLPPAPEPTAPASVKRDLPVAVYFVYEEKLVAVRRTAKAPQVAASAVRALLEGPTDAEERTGIGTQVPDGTSLLGVSIANGIATVDLSGAYDDGGGTMSMSLRLAQVVHTLTQFATVKSVGFRIDGEPVSVFGGEGLLLEGPQTRAGWEDQSPAVLIERPAWGEEVEVGGPVTVSGTANVFEGVFNLDLQLDGSAGASRTQRVQAVSGTGMRGGFAASLSTSGLGPGRAHLVAWYASPKDGKRVDAGRVRIRLVQTANR